MLLTVFAPMVLAQKHTAKMVSVEKLQFKWVGLHYIAFSIDASWTVKKVHWAEPRCSCEEKADNCQTGLIHAWQVVKDWAGQEMWFYFLSSLFVRSTSLKAEFSVKRASCIFPLRWWS